MRNLFLLPVMIVLICTGPVFAQKKSPGKAKVQKEIELVWLTDVQKAREISEKQKKPIFAFFTGSDWCGWCKRLQAAVFAKPEFKEWASKNVVLLELDFPRGKQLSPELMQQNASLQQSFGVRGYPTIWMFYLAKDDAANKFNINALGSLGYPAGAEPGKEQFKFLDEANAILKKKS